jgi:FecR protein
MDAAADVKKVLSALRDRPIGVDGERLDQRRSRALPRLRSELKTQHAARRRRVRIRNLGLLGAGAALFGVALLALRSGVDTAQPTARSEQGSITLEQASGSVLVVSAQHSARGITPGERLPGPVTGELRTSSGSARLRTAEGLSLALSPTARIELSGLGGPLAERHVRLNQGEVSCTVPKLAQGEQFSVVTRDLRVVVHGTVFSVRAAEVARPSCVRVREGRVVVQHAGRESLLTAGQSFGCETEVSPAATTPAPTLPVARAGREPSRRQAGTLGVEADLLGAGLAAEQGGNPVRARERLETLLRLYPSSPLAPEARQALERIQR